MFNALIQLSEKHRTFEVTDQTIANLIRDTFDDEPEGSLENLSIGQEGLLDWIKKKFKKTDKFSDLLSTEDLPDFSDRTVLKNDGRDVTIYPVKYLTDLITAVEKTSSALNSLMTDMPLITDEAGKKRLLSRILSIGKSFPVYGFKLDVSETDVRVVAGLGKEDALVETNNPAQQGYKDSTLADLYLRYKKVSDAFISRLPDHSRASSRYVEQQIARFESQREDLDKEQTHIAIFSIVITTTVAENLLKLSGGAAGVVKDGLRKASKCYDKKK